MTVLLSQSDLPSYPDPYRVSASECGEERVHSQQVVVHIVCHAVGSVYETTSSCHQDSEWIVKTALSHWHGSICVGHSWHHRLAFIQSLHPFCPNIASVKCFSMNSIDQSINQSQDVNLQCWRSSKYLCTMQTTAKSLLSSFHI